MVAVGTIWCCMLALVAVFLAVLGDVTQRVVTVTPWPNCNEYYKDCDVPKKNGSNIIYAKAVAANDSLLYAFSTIGTPSIVVARVTGADTDMHFNWTMLMHESTIEDAITINVTSSKVEYRFGVAFTRLIEYNDKDDTADLNDKTIHNSSYWKIKDLSNFNWVIDPAGPLTDMFVFNASSGNNPDLDNSSSTGNWSINFRFTVQNDAGRSADLPSLKYGANETLMDFVIDKYTPEFSNSRFALEAVLVSQSANKNMKIESIDSIDDEYSPGVFEMINWLTNPSDELSSGYFQWKPVCYNSKDRSRSSATKVKYYDLSGLDSIKHNTKLLNASIIYALFGQDLYNESLVITQATNISFGLSEDGFYVQTNYTAWSAAIGYGNPPVDTISMTVIITISAGLGLPVVILILGGVYTCVKKAKKKSQYEAINSDTVSRTQPLVN